MILLDEGFCERKKNGVVILMHSAYQIFLYVCHKKSYQLLVSFCESLLWKVIFINSFVLSFFSKKESSVFSFGIFRSLQVLKYPQVNSAKLHLCSVSSWLIDCLDSPPQIFPHYVVLFCWLKVAIYTRCTQLLHTYELR